MANKTTGVGDGDRGLPAWRAAVGSAALAAAIAVVPLAFQPLRLDGHESYRAGLLLILVVIGLAAWGGWRERLRGFSPLLLGAATLWCAALAVSALLSLSPARSLFGDTLRHMGLWTQLTLAAGLLFGARTSLRETWRWFWLGGVAVALFVLLQSAGVFADAGQRAAGPMGFSTATGGWLAITILWAGLGVIGEARRERPTLRTLGLTAGLAVMAIALVVSGARAGLLALTGGGVTLILLYAAARRKRGLALVILSVVGATAGGYALLSSIDVDQVPDLLRPLAARVQVDSHDPGLIFRQTVWANSQKIVSGWPVLRHIDGEDDRFAAARPVFGYGAEMFEAVHRPLIPDTLYIPGQRIDRAHNDWLDTLIAAGWLGVGARTLLFAAVWVVALRRLRLYRPIALLFPAASALIAGAAAAAQTAYWLPVAITVGALAGAWLWLGAAAFANRADETPGQLDRHALLALGVLTCHVIDLQFGFETVAAGWAFWLAIGVLAAKAQAPSFSGLERPSPWGWAAYAGALVFRSGLVMGTSLGAGVLFAALLGCAVSVLVKPRPRDLLTVLMMLATAWLATQSTNPVWTAVMDVVLLIAGCAVLGGIHVRTTSLIAILHRIRLVPQRARRALPLHDVRLNRRGRWRASIGLPAALVIGGALVFWACDAIAQVYLREGQTSPPNAQSLLLAAQFAPWDDRIAGTAGAATFAGLQRQYETTGQFDQAALDATTALLDRGVRLNGYDADHALAWANVEANLALVAANPAPHLARAAQFFAAATALWPTEETLWTAWGRFTLDVQGEAPAAFALARQAVCLRPLSMAAIKLLRQSGAAAGLSPYVDCDAPL